MTDVSAEGAMPRVSVIIPTFNRQVDVLEAIASITNETVSFEVIIVDDGSTDDTPRAVAALNDHRVRCIPNSRRKGVAGARNSGMLAAAGSLIAFLDDDDRFLPGHLTAAAAIFEAEPVVGLVFGAASYIRDGVSVPYMGPNFRQKIHQLPAPTENEHSIVYGKNSFLTLLRLGSFFNVSTVVIRREVPDAAILFNEDLFGVEDFDMWIRVAQRHHLACLKAPQAIYHLHDGNMSFGGDLTRRRRTQANGVILWRNILSYKDLPPEAVRIARATLALELADLGYFERANGELVVAREHLRESLRLRWSPTTMKSLVASYLFGRPRAPSEPIAPGSGTA